MRTAFEAWKFAKGLYLIPLFMVYNPEIIVGGPWYIVGWTIITAIAALGAFAAALEGYMFTHMYWFSRILAALGLVGIFWPNFGIEVIGFGLILGVLLINWLKHRSETSQAAALSTDD